MKGRSKSHSARALLPEVRLDQQYASGTGPSAYRSGWASACSSSGRRYMAAVSSPVIRTV